RVPLGGELALRHYGLTRSALHGILQRTWPAFELGPVHIDAARKIAMPGQGVIAVHLVRAIVHRVGERIFLPVDGAGDDRFQPWLQVQRKWYRPLQLETASMHLARHHA